MVCISTSRVYERALFNTCSKILNINFCNFSDKLLKYMYSALSTKQIIMNNWNIRMVTGSALRLFMHRKCALESLFLTMAAYTTRERHSRTHLPTQSPNIYHLQGVVGQDITCIFNLEAKNMIVLYFSLFISFLIKICHSE